MGGRRTYIGREIKCASTSVGIPRKKVLGVFNLDRRRRRNVSFGLGGESVEQETNVEKPSLKGGGGGNEREEPVAADGSGRGGLACFEMLSRFTCTVFGRVIPRLTGREVGSAFCQPERSTFDDLENRNSDQGRENLESELDREKRISLRRDAAVRHQKKMGLLGPGPS